MPPRRAPLTPASEDAARCWHLYVVRTRHDTLYTGIATDVERRFAEHVADASRTARYLRSRGPLTLVYRAPLGEKGIALRAEHAFKRLSRSVKQHIVDSQPAGPALLAVLGIDRAP